MHTTLGIDIGKCVVRLAVCKTDGGQVNFDQLVAFPINRFDDEHGLNTALSHASEWIAHYAKKTPIDASGMTVDPTLALSLHHLMPFNDLSTIEKIMPAQLADVWNLDDSRLLAFEIGEFVKSTASNAEEDDNEDSESTSGYDIHVINYPIAGLSELLNTLQAHNIDPHVVLPANDAMPYALKGILDLPECGWAILDIGCDKSLLTIGIGNKICQTRAFKLGSSAVDQALMEAFELDEKDACYLKETSGFISIPGMEYQTFAQLYSRRSLNTPQEIEFHTPEWIGQNGQKWPVDPAVLAQACARGTEILATAVRQTLASFAAKNPSMTSFQFYLSGGGSKLAGMTEWFSRYLDVPSSDQLPLRNSGLKTDPHFSLEAASVAVAAEINIETTCTLNLRRGPLAHKGSLAYLKDNKWLIASLVIGVIIALVFMINTHTQKVESEHAKLKSALSEATENVFGKKLLKYNQIESEIAASEGFSFIPERTAFTHFAWISSQVNDNLSDVEMDLNSLDIDTQRKIVTIRGEVAGDDGLPRFMQLLEQYECFPNEIPEPKTSKVKERTAFTLRVDANQCKMGGDSE